MARILFSLAFMLISLQAFSQEKCALVPYQKKLAELGVGHEEDGDFEKWVQLKKDRSIRPMPYSRADGSSKSTAATAKWVIPVVVHVIHRGEAVGTGSNIPNEQIVSQFKTLNEDFRALNQSQIDKLPAAFKALAADTEIEFILAKQDPEGLPTDGIVRVFSSQTSWGQEQDLELKSLSHWPASSYLNMYVAPLSSPVIGWAQFPTSDRLNGLNFSDVAEETDGVVIDFRYFGTGYSATSTSTGRTATHEIGHYFGLRHIWGDYDDCGTDDYVDDTPLVGKANYNCPSSTDLPKSCLKNQDGSFQEAMYQNYLDYSDDKCMALFTLGQKQRMDVVLQYSPRRKELHYSLGKQEPTKVANDAGLRALSLGLTQLCNSGYIPTIEVRNYGSNQVTQVQVALSVDGTLTQTHNLSTNIAYLESQTFQLNELQLSSGYRSITANITLTNGQQDGKSINNDASTSVAVPHKALLPVTQNFESSQGGFSPYSFLNPDKSYSWELANAPNGISTFNKAAFINLYDYPTTGEKDLLISPLLDLRNESKLFLTLNLAYARYDRNSNDGLEIWVSTDCSASLLTAERVFEARGEALETAPPTAVPFAPSDMSQWKSLALDLSAYAGQDNVQIFLVSVAGYGNNLFLDDIVLSNVLNIAHNVTITQIINPSPVIGNKISPLNIRLKNLGTQDIQSLRARVILNGSEIKDVQLSEMGLSPLSENTFSLGYLPQLSEGPHLLRVHTYAPNGASDGNSFDNTFSMQFVLNTRQGEIPNREEYSDLTFNDGSWTSTNPDFTDTGWITTPVLGHNGQPASKNHAALAQFESSMAKQHKWLVSPRFDLSQVEKAGIQFWYYAGGENRVSLRLLASTDGGFSWPITLWEKDNQQLKEGNPSASLSPENASTWRKEFLSLGELLLPEAQDIRFALVATGESSSSVYVDDIEFFLSDLPYTYELPNPNDVAIFPNPAHEKVTIAFNMKQKEKISLELINSQGASFYKTSLPGNTFNQNYTIVLPNIPAGIYYIRIRSASLNTTRKLVVVK